jgi:hypothetical protein
VASWREEGKVRNVHLGSCEKLSREDALQKARKMKAEALGISTSTYFCEIYLGSYENIIDFLRG